MENKEEIIKSKNLIINNLFKGNSKETYYLETYGFIGKCKIPVYRNFFKLYSKIFFSILNEYNLDYYVFAGTSIGYIRNKKNIPWIDDYDIIIFEEEFKKFINIIIPKLIDYGFSVYKQAKRYYNGGYQIYSTHDNSFFQCDVFFTKIKNNILKNTNNWGLYTYKNISIDMVKPKQFLTIDDDLTLPFFNKIEEDVLLEYGDVMNSCMINIDHVPSLEIKNKYEITYEAFNNIKEEIIEKTKNLFHNHKYLNNLTLTKESIIFEKDDLNSDNKNNNIKFLKYVNNNNIKTLSLFSEDFLIYCPDIKYYFKDIVINFYIIEDFDKKNLIFLNYLDNIFCSKQDYIDKINSYKHLFQLNHKPVIDYLKVITFGTFDLFHIGHDNILKRAKKFGDLVVGVSTDELNNKKGKKSINNLEKRIMDIKNSGYASIVFEEESLELKNDYVKKYNSNLLIMGDDWKDKFNFCDCACIYLPRTPNISTTLLKKNMGLI